MTARIVYTRPDGGVNICHPAPQIISVLGSGGWFGAARRGTLDAHIEAEIAAGRPAVVAQRYIHALAFGGCSTAEAYEIIRDRDCAPHGTAHELVTDFNIDRWFRRAWRRGHNGGPIDINMVLARKIQLRRIKAAAASQKADLELVRWRERIRAASSPGQLRQIWPRGLKRHG